MENLIHSTPQLLALTFLAITFLQSGLDKILDWSGNLEFLSGHFSKSPLAAGVPLLFAVLTVFETSAGLLSAFGVVGLLLGWTAPLGLYGALVAAVSILMLLFGQRIAKDYDGASVLPGYFLVALAAIYLCL